MDGHDEPGRGGETPRERISRLSAAILRIIASLDVDTVQREVVESACALIGARNGVITTVDEAAGEHSGVGPITASAVHTSAPLQRRGFFRYLKTPYPALSCTTSTTYSMGTICRSSHFVCSAKSRVSTR
ncbi:MAG: hypothetical protein OXE44_04870 [Nitrospinae bacterium]|nr:hypothetical protein [Nitrospinota bacterium]